MKISVVIPTYKPQAYIWECLDSIREQTFSNDLFEVIIVLNGCSEPWKSEIDKYLKVKMSSFNVVLIQIDEGGVSNARNVALDIARGEYIAFIDDDDMVSPFYLEGLYEKVSYDTVSLCCPCAFKDGTNEYKPYSLTSVYEKRALIGRQSYQFAKKYFSGPCMKLIPMTFIKNRRFDVKFTNGEDSLFMFLISDQFKYVDFTTNKSVYYRRYRENSAVTRFRSRSSKILNGVRLYIAYTRVYLSQPAKYNFFYYTRCVLGIIRGMFA